MRRRLLQAALAAFAAAAALPASGQAPFPARGQAPSPARRLPRLNAFEVLFGDLVREQRVPGAALAVTHAGRLVHAAGYGDAQADSLFRIASLSKPLTAATVLRLAEHGALSLADRAWDLLSLPPPADARCRRITLLHLLQHTAGWDHAPGRDPMFARPAPASAHELVAAMASSRLDADPGTRHAYSNFGYFLLGRAIERATGLGYQEAVRREVLEPLGMRSLRVVPPEGGTATLSDAHAGWSGSALDLARFARAFDERDACPLLSPAGWDAMHARPEGAAGLDANGAPLAAFYACGWMVRPLGRLGQAWAWHDGSLESASALMVRGYDRTNWVALFAARTGADDRLLPVSAERPLHRAVALTPHWPPGDGFAAAP